jgi:hypothetical protein
MGNSIDKEINDLLWRLEYIGKYTTEIRQIRISLLET